MTEQKLSLALLAITAGLAPDLDAALAFVDAQLAPPAPPPGGVIGRRHELRGDEFVEVEIKADGTEREVSRKRVRASA